jgi:tetratricopeptide (TPR) repeat protein
MPLSRCELIPNGVESPVYWRVRPHLRDTSPVSPAGIRHEAFFATLGKMPEDHERWPALLAALVTLRMIDEWVAAQHVPAEMLAAVQTTLETVPADDPSRHLVSDLLAPIARRDTPTFRTVAPPLLAYAHWLQDNSHWPLADDVYTTVWLGLTSVARVADVDLADASEAALLAATCRRNTGDPTGAEAAYAAAHALATERGDEVRLRRAELGYAKVAQMRGNLPAAEAALRELIAHTMHPTLAGVRALAYHDLGVALFWREEYDAALKAYYEALTCPQDPKERMRVVADIGGVLGELGYVPEARIADRLVWDRSADIGLEGVAGVNLMELARLDGNEAEFARYRDLVAQKLDRLPIKTQVDYYYTLGLGFETFGDRKRALKHYDRAIELAETHGLGQELYRIDCARDTVVDGLSNVLPPVPPPHLDSVVRLGQALQRESVAAR